MRQKKSSGKKSAPKAALAIVRAKPAAKKVASKAASKRAPAKPQKTAAVAKKAAVAVKRPVIKQPVIKQPVIKQPVIKRANPEAPPVAPKKLKQAAIKTRARPIRQAKFAVGQVVRHRIYPFRGVVFDIDPVFANTEEWLAAIPPDVRPRRNQPFYHLLAESAETEYIAYVSEQNLLPDETGQPLRHPQITEYFVEEDDGTLRAVFLQAH